MIEHGTDEFIVGINFVCQNQLIVISWWQCILLIFNHCHHRYRCAIIMTQENQQTRHFACAKHARYSAFNWPHCYSADFDLQQRYTVRNLGRAYGWHYFRTDERHHKYHTWRTSDQYRVFEECTRSSIRWKTQISSLRFLHVHPKGIENTRHSIYSRTFNAYTHIYTYTHMYTTCSECVRRCVRWCKNTPA